MERNQSNKSLKTLERVKGIEPSYSAWKAAALPLSYTRETRITYHAGHAASTVMRMSSAVPHRPSPLRPNRDPVRWYRISLFVHEPANALSCREGKPVSPR